MEVNGQGVLNLFEGANCPPRQRLFEATQIPERAAFSGDPDSVPECSPTYSVRVDLFHATASFKTERLADSRQRQFST